MTLLCLQRSHEVKDEGYEIEPGGRVVTVFSAPNYCDQFGNKGCYAHFDHTYVAVPCLSMHVFSGRAKLD